MNASLDEDARLAALHSYGMLDGPRPPVLDELTRLAASMFDTPMSAVSLVDRDWQWLAGNTGLADAPTPRDTSFCAHTLPAKQPLVVPDATRDPRFAAYTTVTGAPHIRFYAGAPLVDEDGYALGAVCVVDDRARDIGDRQRDALVSLSGQAASHLALIRNRLRLANLGDELARATQREEDLVATISHELRTPVAAIQGYLELLTDNADLSPYRQLVDPIQRNGERLVAMVDHLLAGARPNNAPRPVHTSLIDLAPVVTAAIARCGPLAELRDVTVTMHVERSVPAHADPTRLGQAAEQLLRNAILFTPAGGSVKARVRSGSQPMIDVVDTGVGIPASELPHVFDRFYRGRYAREQAIPGMGLGLGIARNVITAQGGALTLASSASGTAAQVTLPALG